MCRSEFSRKPLQKVTSGKVVSVDTPETVRLEGLLSSPSPKEKGAACALSVGSGPWGSAQCTSQDAVHSLPPESGCKCLPAIGPSRQGAEPCADSGADVCQLCLR